MMGFGWLRRGFGSANRVARLAALCCAGIAFTAVVGAGALFFLPADVEDFAAVKAKWAPSEAYLLDRNGVPLDQQRMDYTFRRFEWTSLDSVSPALIAAIVDGEDRHFWEHEGVDWRAILGAVRDQSVSQRRRGASTITMQLAKLLQPAARAGDSPGAMWRKFAQVRVARTLESSWSKRQILEAYLNAVGFRGELQGVDAASRVLAGKAPSGLSLAESIVLAALLPSPSAPSQAIVSRACARAAARRVSAGCDEIRSRAAEMLGRFDRSGGELAADLHQAPHLARVMLHKAGERVRTTLDVDVQRMANGVLKQHLAALTARNVRDGAVLVVDNETGDVLAYVGSGGSTSRAREVDGVRARRQAGSTLKPFLYELAIERGYLNSASLLNDAPVAVNTASGIYLPQNYDRDFKGLVSVRTALGSSLNVPAVRTLVLTGVEPFRDRLASLGYGVSQPGDFYGYALALGSPEVSLWEQVQAYRVLARGGEFSAISARRDATGRVARDGATRVRFEKSGASGSTSVAGAGASDDVRRAASFIVSDMMSDRSARTVTFGLDNYLNTPFWSAVKTGTSKDMRDNWCIGFSSAYTVGVWVGNFEGDSMHDVSGITGAAPVWNQIMLALHANTQSVAPSSPAGVVTSLTHFSPAVEAPRHEVFLRTAAAGSAASASNVGGGSAAGAATPDEAAPPTAVVALSEGGEIARIASPANGMVIALDPDIPPAVQRVPLSASGVHEGMILKLNGAVLGTATGKVLWSPRPGKHVLALEDATGRTLDSSRFVVR
jgi:penicillin-binding protein 1C